MLKATAISIASFTELHRRTDDLPSHWALRAKESIGMPFMTKRPKAITPKAAQNTFAITLSILLKRKFWVRRARPGRERVAVIIIPNVLSRGRPIRAFSSNCRLTNGHRTIALREKSRADRSWLARSI